MKQTVKIEHLTHFVWFSETVFMIKVKMTSHPIYLSIRLNSSHGGGTPGDPAVVHESPHHAQTTPDGLSRPSSDEGENEEREDSADKLDCHYSGYHPRPAAVSAPDHHWSLISHRQLFFLLTLRRIVDFQKTIHYLFLISQFSEFFYN